MRFGIIKLIQSLQTINHSHIVLNKLVRNNCLFAQRRRTIGMEALVEEKVTLKKEEEGQEQGEGQSQSQGMNKDPFAYLQRDEFTSELYKIEVRGIPKYFGFKEVKKLLNNKLNLNSHKIKLGGKGMGSGLMYVTFKTEEEKQKGLQVLNGYMWKNKKLMANSARAAEDPFMKKRKIEEVDKDSGGFIHKDESIEDTIKRVTIPWCHIPYDEQLDKKMEAVDKLVVDMTEKIFDINPQLCKGTEKICTVDRIKASPVTERYRNKCEFSIGYNPTGNEKMVGFRASSYKEGSTAIGPIDHLIHLPTNMVKTALAFQEFIRSSEDICPFDPVSHVGWCKQITVRTTYGGEVMVVVHVVEKGLSESAVESMKQSLTKWFSSMSDPKLDSCFIRMVEEHGQRSKNLPELLCGNDYITETLFGLKFHISPEAFFQINVPATDVLYATIADLLESNPKTTVLDVCCGTGTIGISVASKCGQVLGIEMVESAVVDARRNAEINGLTEKCEFFSGRAENVIEAVLAKAKFENIVAIVDPPRSGLHNRVLTLLRKCEKIKKIIYVSCDPRLAMKNFVDLARPASKNYRGAPFVPIKIIPVDMFPHCHQHELVILFERIQENTCDKVE